MNIKDEEFKGDPIRNLWASVVAYALKDGINRGDSWFFTSSGSSFKWICHQLGYNATKMRDAAVKKIHNRP